MAYSRRRTSRKASSYKAPRGYKLVRSSAPKRRSTKRRSASARRATSKRSAPQTVRLEIVQRPIDSNPIAEALASLKKAPKPPRKARI